jgi:chromosome segregation ATPase
MNDVDQPQGIGNLDDLDQKAKQAADELNTASSHSAIWDKAAKALKPGLANLKKTREDAQKAADEAGEFLEQMEESYDSDASDLVRKNQKAVDTEISALGGKMDDAWKELNKARDAATKAKNDLDQSSAAFDAAQKELIGVPKMIQDQQKVVTKLQGEARDADAKRQFVDAVVKLEDLKTNLEKFRNWIKPEFETKKWEALNAAADDLVKKTDALPKAQAMVPPAEAAYQEAKAEYEEAVKNRLDTIKQRLPDAEKQPEAVR